MELEKVFAYPHCSEQRLELIKFNLRPGRSFHLLGYLMFFIKPQPQESGDLMHQSVCILEKQGIFQTYDFRENFKTFSKYNPKTQNLHIS